MQMAPVIQFGIAGAICLFKWKKLCFVTCLCCMFEVKNHHFLYGQSPLIGSKIVFNSGYD